jgi:hypothetical protein
MKKIFYVIAIVIGVTSCKGRNSGPLAKESFSNESKPAMAGQMRATQVVPEKANVQVTPGPGCISISTLYSEKKSNDGKIVKVKGIVTKFNSEIMGKNWVHIQDGTGTEGSFDLTITTSQTVAYGDTVTFEGKIALDKDFGYGYFYNVIMEEGKLVK